MNKILVLWAIVLGICSSLTAVEKPRIIVTSDGEIDDQCSMIRFMLYTNECDVEGIISSSSQYHAHGHNWAGDDWIEPDLAAYAQVYPNLVKHDPAYPTPEYLRERVVLGNVKAEGDMAEPTAGSNLIVKVLLDKTDNRPVWMQAWGGMNTIARALKTIEEEHPERMAEVAKKCRFFFIWEQDRTYQDYIRPVWGKYEIPTIISDQFEAIAYRWKQAQPEELHKYFEAAWMKENILENHGPLCSIYAAHENGDFRSEGDSPSFLHTIVTGLRNMESPDWGGWGGRYVRLRENTWLDPVPVKGYVYPSGRWYGNTGWGRNSLRPSTTSTPEQRKEYFKPMWRWTAALQNDFAARADWCVKSYENANHPPVVKLAHALDLKVRLGQTVKLSALGTSDPDGDELTYRWWQYHEADTYKGTVEIHDAEKQDVSFTVPYDVGHAKTIHVICEVTDSGSPPLTRYQRVVLEVNDPIVNPGFTLNADGMVEIPSMTAHFPLDGGNDAVVTDVITGQKGKLTNADPSVSWIDGVIGGAVHLDGHDDRIIVPHHEAYDFGKESFTISFWMRWPKGLPSGNEHILTKGDYESSLPGETGKRWELYISSGNLRFNIDDDVAKSQIQVSLQPYVTGQWVHVAAVRDTKSKLLKLYANGVLLPPSNPGNPGNDGTHRTGNISNPRALYIGDASREDAPYQGDMDDLRLFLAALTDEQVAALAAKAPLVEKEVKKAPAKKTVRAAKPSELPPMTAHFPLNEGEGTVITDLVSGATGKLENANDSVWSSSPKGMALKLDGIDQRVVIPNSPGFDFSDESFSVSFHVRWKKNSTVHHQHFICKGDYDTAMEGETGKRWEMNIRSRGFIFILDDGTNKSELQVAGDTILKGDWVHVVAIRDRKTKTMKLYFNGKLQKSNDPQNDRVNGTDTTGSISNPRELVIADSSRRDNAFEGEIADVRIFRAALTESQVLGVAKLRASAAANPEKAKPLPPMTAHFPLDETQGTAVKDVVNNVTGSLKNADPATAWTPGVLGGALYLDGIDDRVIVPNHPAYDMADESFSVSFLIRWPQGGISPHAEHVLTKGDYASAAPGETGKRWEIIFISRGMCFNVDDAINKSQIGVASDEIFKGDWVHVVAVRDTTEKRLKLYINGELRPSIDPESYHYDGIDKTGSISNPRDLFIGDASRRDNPLKGELDDIRIYRSALSMHQVAALTKSLKPAMAKAPKPIAIATSTVQVKKVVPARAPRPFATPTLLAHWPMDDKKGTVVKEVVGGQNGTLTNSDPSTAWIAGKVGGALQLDGKDDRIFVPNDLAFDFAEESFTVAFWMKWKPGTHPHSQHLITKGDYHSAAPDQTGKRWEIFVAGDTMSFTIDDDIEASRNIVPLAPFSTGQWVHIAAVRDVPQKQLRLYANGKLLAPIKPDDEKTNGTDRSGDISNPQRLTIGDAYLCDNPFPGGLDDLRVYLGALSDKQIAAAAKAKANIPPMTAHFPLDEGKGTTVTEVINGVKGELVNADPAASWISGKLGGALRLDGIDDRVFVPHHPGFDFADESFSVSFQMRWPKGREVYSDRFFTKGDYSSAEPGQTGKRWELWISNHKNMTFGVDDDVYSSRLKVPLDPFITGEWIHVVAVRDTENKQLRLYANGVLQKSIDPNHPRSNGTDLTGSISNPQRLTIGDAFVLDAPFEGDLDDIRIFRAALTDEQIIDLGKAL